MINKLEINDDTFYVEVSDMITKEDVESVIPQFDELLKTHVKVKGVIHLNHVKGYTFGGFLADFNYYFKHKNSFSYMAVVGDDAYEKALIELIDKLMPGKAKFFDASELDKAKEWINQV